MRTIRRQKAKTLVAGNIVRIDDGFHIIDDVIRTFAGQVFITYAGKRTRTINGIKYRLREVRELHADDFVHRQRQTQE